MGRPEAFRRGRIRHAGRQSAFHDVGSYTGLAKIDRIKPGNIQVHWPEGNCLLSREEIDLASREPDYNAIVRAEKRTGTEAVAKQGNRAGE